MPLSEHPEYPVAIVKALLASPEYLCPKGESRLLTSADLASLSTTNKDNAVAAAGMMKKAWKVLEGLDLDRTVRERLYGEFQMKLIMHVHKKVVKGRKSFKTIAEIGIDFSAIVVGIAPIQCEQIELPWKAAVDASDKSTSSRRQYDASGDIEGHVERSRLQHRPQGVQRSG